MKYMITSFLFIIPFMTVMMTGCSNMVSTPAVQSPQIPKQFVDRQILVTLSDSLKPQWKNIATEIGNEYGIQLSGEFPLTSIAVDCLVFKVPEQHSLGELLQRLNQDKRVVLAQENQIFDGLAATSGQLYQQLSYGPKLIQALSVHRLATGRGVKIAVVDTGADREHPDLQGRIISTLNFVEGGESSFSGDRHGTAVTGIIGAMAGNGIGIDGIAPNAEIMVMKSCWYDGRPGAGATCSSWTLAKAIDAAINDGVQIINLSLAGPYDRLLESLLETADQRGITIVAASFENKTKPGFPAQLSYVIPAISAGPDGSVVQPDWLTRIQSVVAAPGVEIVTTTPHGEYDILSGSSLAAAHVSGVVALLLEYQPSLKPHTIKCILGGDSADPQHPRPVDALRVLKKIAVSRGC